MRPEPFYFLFDERLQVERPYLRVDYEKMTGHEQEDFEVLCQHICSFIPEKIREFEREYMRIFDQLSTVDREEEFVRINKEMNDISSRISDLNLLYLYIEGSFLGASVYG